MEPDTATSEATQSQSEPHDEPAASVAEEVVKPKAVRTKFRSTIPGDGPDLALGESGLSAEKPITLGEMFKMTVSKIPEHPALRYKIEDTWHEFTFQQYYDFCIAAAKSFLKVNILLHIDTLIAEYLISMDFGFFLFWALFLCFICVVGCLRKYVWNTFAFSIEVLSLHIAVYIEVVHVRML